MTKVDMAAYGLTDRHAAAAQEYGENTVAGRILSQEKGLYRLVSERGEQLAEVSGRLRYKANSPADFPAVGDFVVTDCNLQQGRAVIHGVLPRKSLFIRKAAGTDFTEQVVAANIDTVFICTSLNNDFNLRRLERYLALAWDSGASPVIVLTKADLCPDPAHFIRQVQSVAFGVDILLCSALEQDGYKKLLPYIGAGKTVALIGSSGVGKSTLINRLLGEERLDTNGLRGDGRGRHTTTRRELFLLKEGGMVIDTPGMRELGLWENEEGLEKSFSDIEALAAGCRFRNCSHTKEPGCAVRAALAQGELSEARWQSYRKLKTESRYMDDTEGYLAEKNAKFKNIAKINRTSRRKEGDQKNELL